MSVKPNQRSSSALLLAAAAQAAGRGGAAAPTSKPNLIAGIAGFVLGYFRHRESLSPSHPSGGLPPPGRCDARAAVRTRRRLATAKVTSTGGHRHG